MRPALPNLPGLHELIRHADRLQLRNVSRWLGLSLLIGVTSGCLAMLFFLGMDWVSHIALDGWVGLPPSEPDGEKAIFARDALGPPRSWALLLMPALGGLVSSMLVWRFAKEAEGHGTDALIDAFHNDLTIRPRVPLVKGLASVIVIGTGGSAGREGPIAQISGSIGQMWGHRLGLSQRECRLLLLAGAAGGIGAIFRTPLGAALFIIEVLYRDDTEVDAFMPAVLSSVAAYSTFTLVLGNQPIFSVASPLTFHPSQLPLYVLMSLGCALFGFLFVEVFYGGRKLAMKQTLVPPVWLPALGGLGVGALALLTPVALGTGYGALQDVFHGDYWNAERGWLGAGVLLGFGLLKIVTTTLSVASGGSGGVFGPSVVIGGFVGAAFGQIFHHLMPQLAPYPNAFVIVGMAAFVGGVARAPVSTLVMATEMTGGYELLVPLMLAEAITFVVLQPWTLYEKQVPSRKESGAHWAEHMFDVLHDHHVAETFKPVDGLIVIPAATPLGEVMRTMSSSTQTAFPVIARDGRPEGLISLEGLRSFMFEDGLDTLAVADDCYQPFVTLLPSDTLSTALDRFISSRIGQLPVVSEEAPDKIIGLLSYEDLMATYDDARATPLMRERREPFSLRE